MRPCPSFRGYSATEDGRIISHRRRGVRTLGAVGGSVTCIDRTHCYELARTRTAKGYLTVSVVQPSGKSRPIGVHQLVADAFHGPAPNGTQVRHLNGVPSDNRYTNLAHGTALDNAQDRQRHGTYLGGSNHHSAKLKPGHAAAIRRARRFGEPVKALAKRFDVSVSTIESVIYGKSYRPSPVSTDASSTESPE
ncbi:HNH endonuclease signature motif containing protein [Paraburkholderia sp.]|uniref:HNH endonuclease signature motif containing protein n=1 Tax=Paraburkholderia sp. TaxID=1926495 RepID=UPI003434E073